METVSARIYGAVKQKISEGHYAPGSRITEQQIAAEFDTSRTPVREAMRLLVADGLVLFKPNSGTVVREWTSQQMEQLFDARMLIESELAAAAALHIEADALSSLELIQQEIELCAANPGSPDTPRIGRLNREFHRVLAASSRNDRLVAMLANAMEVPVVQQTFRRYTPSQLRRSSGHHRELLDALAVRDAAWARSIMSCHILAAKHALLGYSRVQDRPSGPS